MQPTTFRKPPIPVVQGQFLRFIHDYHKRERRSPCLRELIDASGRTKSGVCTILRGLLKNGFIAKLPQHGRKLVVTEAGQKVLRKAL